MQFLITIISYGDIMSKWVNTNNRTATTCWWVQYCNATFSKIQYLYHNVQYLRQYLVLYHDINIILIYHPVLFLIFHPSWEVFSACIKVYIHICSSSRRIKSEGEWGFFVCFLASSATELIQGLFLKCDFETSGVSVLWFWG